MGLSARLLLPGDEECVDSFLKPHTPHVFFMRSNLKRGGLRYEGKPNQGDFFGAFDSGRLIGVLQHGWIGNVQIFAPLPHTVPLLVQLWRDHLAGHPRMIECFLGPAAHVDALFSACGIDDSALKDKMPGEGLFTLALQNMIEPPLLQKAGVSVRRAVPADIDLLSAWRHDFYVESRGFAQGQETYDKAKNEMTRRTQEGDLFILEDNSERVSFGGAGGFLPDWTHVGPVWTPPEKRGRGYARTVTAGSLRILAKDGITDACLSARRPDAIKAYLAIGFERIGDWQLEDLITPVDRL